MYCLCCGLWEKLKERHEIDIPFVPGRYLDFNSLTGSVPSELGALSELNYMYVFFVFLCCVVFFVLLSVVFFVSLIGGVGLFVSVFLVFFCCFFVHVVSDVS